MKTTTPFAKIGDNIKIYLWGELENATVVSAGFAFSDSAFNTYTVLVESNKEKMKVCWNPFLGAFTGFDS